MQKTFEYQIKTKVFDCVEETNQNSGQSEFRVYHTGGNCKSDIEIKPGTYRLKIRPMAINNRLFIRILKVARTLHED